jgi:hypothetical protein
MAIIYLDIDGVLLRRSQVSRSGFEVSPGAEQFLAYCASTFDVRWLTTRCRKGMPNDDVNRAFRHAMEVTSLPPRLAELIALVQPTTWTCCKAEAIDFTSSFFWVDDNPTPNALQVLAKHGCQDRWIKVRVDQDPGDLLRVRQILEQRILAVQEKLNPNTL